MLDKKKHWENIYKTKEPTDLSWHQSKPEISLDFITNAQISQDAKIIDVGGGDSRLVDYLLELGYKDITVLDIAAASLERAVKRLGKKAEQIKWIIADITTFEPTEQYDLWHDRAAFHFLTEEKQIQAYLSTVNKGIKEKGTMIIGAFSEEGPSKCSGVEVKQYKKESMQALFKPFFEMELCKTVDHETPKGALQKFVFCQFRKKLGERKIGEILDADDKDKIRKLPLSFLEGQNSEKDFS